jgi:transcriptional regulator with XRE-family HTH domain
MNTTGKRIQDLRKKQELNQTELAKRVGMSLTQLQRYENKDVQPPADVLKRLADLFGVSIDYIVNGTAQEKASNTLLDAALIKQFQEIELLPNDEKETLLKVVTAYIRDFKAKQNYAG